jgi:release factor glutamine methyltransferase
VNPEFRGADACLTVGQALRLSPAVDPRDARLLLRHVLGATQAQLIAYPERALSAAERERYLTLVDRRAAGEPVAYLLGVREFFSLDLRVTPDVLIPRPETEHLVEHALARLAPGAGRRALDLGTGSGAVAIALALSRPDALVIAADISEAALALARENARRHSAAVLFLRSDWMTPIEGAFDLIVSNPPYVRSDDPHLDLGDVRFEPRLALVAGKDGLDCIRTIVLQARTRLREGGWLLFEHGYDQGPAGLGLLEEAGYAELTSLRDLVGHLRVSAGRWRG